MTARQLELETQVILSSLKEHNITLNFDKCEFEKERVTFLGHVISAKGTEPDPGKIQAIKDYTSPKNKKQLQGFLGTVDFYSKFSSQFAFEIVPMLELLRKRSKCQWKPKHEEAFARVKNLFGK